MCKRKDILQQWFSAFLVLGPSRAVSQVAVTPSHKIIFCCYFITVLRGERGRDGAESLH